MANQWFRMYAEFATDPKVQMLSETLQRRYIMLLCLRCNVNSNDNITLHETLTDENLAFQLRISNEEWLETKHIFINKNLINEHNIPINWDKRQYISDTSNERVKRFREKKKRECNVTVTPPEADTDTEYISTTAYARHEKFSMHLGWKPDAKTWRTQQVANGLQACELTPEALKDSITEFISYWIANPNRAFSQTAWERKLAQAIVKKRAFKGAENHAANEQRNQSSSTGIERTATDTSWNK